jgi:hypothetical protein
MSRREQLRIGELTLVGSGAQSVTPLIRDKHNHVMLCVGTAIPNGKNGYAKGCILLYQDGRLYTNYGTYMLSDFQTIESTQVRGGNFTF